MCQGGKDDPFCNLRTVDTRGGCQGDVGRCVYGVVGDVICTGREDMYKLLNRWSC